MVYLWVEAWKVVQYLRNQVCYLKFVFGRRTAYFLFFQLFSFSNGNDVMRLPFRYIHAVCTTRQAQCQMDSTALPAPTGTQDRMLVLPDCCATVCPSRPERVPPHVKRGQRWGNIPQRLIRTTMGTTYDADRSTRKAVGQSQDREASHHSWELAINPAVCP